MFPGTPRWHLEFRLRDAGAQIERTSDLRVHTLELPKYRAKGHNLPEATPLEKWAYFLKFADRLTARELAVRLVDPEFVQAAGVLEMISHTPEERARYEARQKFLRDEAGRLERARAEGQAEGLELGVLAGRAQLLQQLLGIRVAGIDELSAVPSSQLEALVRALERRLQSRK